MRYCVIHYCVVQSTCSYIILTLQTNRRLHTLLMTRQMGMLRRKRKFEFQLGDIKIWENNGVLKILKSKTSVGSASKETKKSCNRTRCAGWIRVSLGNVSMNSTGRREKLKKRKREQFWIGFRAVLKPPGESLSRSCYCRQVFGFIILFMKPSSSLLSSKVTPPSVT